MEVRGSDIFWGCFFGHMRFRLLGSNFGRLGQFSDVGFFFLGCSVFIAEMRSEIFIPSHPLIAFKPVYTEAFKAVCSSLWQSMISAVLHASLIPFIHRI